jgi:Holliday junction resolvase
LLHFSFPVVVDKTIEDKIKEIYVKKGGKRAGCFDVVAHNGNNFVFIELKRKSKDSIRETQIEWLAAALATKTENARFLIAEWDLQKE